jgi:hypothetical protein
VGTLHNNNLEKDVAEMIVEYKKPCVAVSLAEAASQLQGDDADHDFPIVATANVITANVSCAVVQGVTVYVTVASH